MWRILAIFTATINVVGFWILFLSSLAIIVWLWAGSGGDIFVQLGRLLYGPFGALATLVLALWYSRDFCRRIRQWP